MRVYRDVLRITATAGVGISFLALLVQPLAAQNPVVGSNGHHMETGQASDPLNRFVSVHVRAVSLRSVLDQIKQQANLRLLYDPEALHVDRPVTLQIDSVSARDALKRLLVGTGFVIKVSESGGVMLVRPAAPRPDTTSSANDTHGAIEGVVRDDENGTPLPHVAVLVLGTSLRTLTDAGGRFALRNIPGGDQTLKVQILGYSSVSRVVSVIPRQQTSLVIPLHPISTRLLEVVTTATGPQRRVELGNSIVTLDAQKILAETPITSLTQMLEGRVPGLQVIHTSGTPGDPARLRLRGPSSAYLSNDPIVIVDGVRIYADQSADRSRNLAALQVTTSHVGTPAPSPLDQIDPNSVEKIEVFKGPSAATLYGADAANGVIVITTKKGQVGKTRWGVTAMGGTTSVPGDYPLGYYRWGRNVYTDELVMCRLGDLTCTLDSVSRFQALNHAQYSPLGTGNDRTGTLSVSGGVTNLTYSFTGSYNDQIGVLTLPSYEATQFTDTHGFAPPSWMRRPDKLTQWGVHGSLSATLSPALTLNVSSMLSSSHQQRSSLETQLNIAMSTYIDEATGTFYRGGGGIVAPTSVYLPDFFRRATDASLNSTNALTANWQPAGWFSGSADAGINTINRVDDVLLPRGYMIGTTDSVGSASTGRGVTTVETGNLRGTFVKLFPWQSRAQLSLGMNYTITTIADLVSNANDIPLGVETFSSSTQGVFSSETRQNQAGVGFYVAPTIAIHNFYFSPGLRFDGGNSWGASQSYVRFPKVSTSWLVSDESFFPWKNVINAFRLRVAYGQAGVQPGARDKYRLYTPTTQWIDGQSVPIISLSSVGNTDLGPERSTETEGGFDLDLFEDRLTIEFTHYRKMRVDALMQVPLAPSVYGDVNVVQNIGSILNTGSETAVTAELVRSSLITWNTSVSFSTDNNKVVSLGQGVRPFSSGTSRIVAGYPLFSRWAKPIVAYVDANHDHIISADEVQVGDSLAYMGSTSPDLTANFNSTIGLWNGRVRVSATLAYEGGRVQVNQAIRQNQTFSRALNDSTASLGEQAAVAVINQTDYGLIQAISTLRFNEFSVTYQVPTAVRRAFHASMMSVALQGRNVGLFTNYKGKDPDVNAYASGNDVSDGGQLPMPRTWELRLNLNY